MFNKHKKQRLGSVAQKILLLLGVGITLSLTTRPDYSFRIMKSVNQEWNEINQRRLREAIRRLYQSKLIDYKENSDETITLVLAEEGRKRFLRYNLDNLKIKKPSRWDRLWRIIIFDIPEYKKQARDALAVKLKKLGFYQFQKSVFIYPYECKDEIDFIIEIFEIKPYVRFILAKETDIDLDLKNRFELK